MKTENYSINFLKGLIVDYRNAKNKSWDSLMNNADYFNILKIFLLLGITDKDFSFTYQDYEDYIKEEIKRETSITKRQARQQVLTTMNDLNDDSLVKYITAVWNTPDEYKSTYHDFVVSVTQEMCNDFTAKLYDNRPKVMSMLNNTDNGVFNIVGWLQLEQRKEYFEVDFGSPISVAEQYAVMRIKYLLHLDDWEQNDLHFPQAIIDLKHQGKKDSFETSMKAKIESWHMDSYDNSAVVGRGQLIDFLMNPDNEHDSLNWLEKLTAFIAKNNLPHSYPAVCDWIAGEFEILAEQAGEIGSYIVNDVAYDLLDGYEYTGIMSIDEIQNILDNRNAFLKAVAMTTNKMINDNKDKIKPSDVDAYSDLSAEYKSDPYYLMMRALEQKQTAADDDQDQKNAEDQIKRTAELYYGNGSERAEDDLDSIKNATEKLQGIVDFNDSNAKKQIFVILADLYIETR